MKNIILFTCFVAVFAYCSCHQTPPPTQNKPLRINDDELFAKQALEVVKEIEKETKMENELKLKENDFSEGVQEIIDFFDYKHPLLISYGKPTTIKSNKEFNNLLLKNDALSVKNLALINDPTNDPIKIQDLSKFKNLEFLSLNSFDSIPPGFYDLTKLKVFMCSDGLRVKMTSEIANLKNLEYLQLLFTYLELDENIQQLKKLETIRMYTFSNDQPYESIYNLPNLKLLSVKYSDDAQLKGISQLKSLRTLITNKVTPEVGDLNLTGLVIQENNDADYSESLGKLENLEAFYWHGNYTQDTAPKFVAKLKNLEYIKMSGGPQFKHIPSEYDGLSNLKLFDITCRPKFVGKIDHLKNIKDKIKIN